MSGSTTDSTTEAAVAYVGLVFGIIGTLGFIIVTISCCIIWRRSHKQFVLLKREVERGRCATRSPVDPNMAPIEPPTSHPDHQFASSNPVAITPLGGSPAHPQSQSESRGYSYVNKLSLLPTEVRTAANLEGETLPLDQEMELVEQYKKERADYEEQQLLKMTELKAQRAMGGGSSPSKEAGRAVFQTTPTHSRATPTGQGRISQGAVGGYEMVEPEQILGKTPPNVGGVAKAATKRMDPYEDPADAIVGSEMGKVGVAMGVAKKTPPSGQKKVWSVGGSGEAAGEEYTPVFNTLPKNSTTLPPQQHQVTTNKSRRSSDSTPSRKPLQPASVAGHNYENNPVPSPSKARHASFTAEDSSPEHPSGTAEERNVPIGQASPNQGDMKRDDTRQSKRKPAKEVVEFDPNKQKKFRMSSSVKKPKKKGDTGQADEATADVDTKAEETDDSKSEPASDPPAAAAAIPEARTTPVKTFDIESETGALSYAVVNLGDKKKNRVETDGNKIEGSGIPQHYRVPITSS